MVSLLGVVTAGGTSNAIGRRSMTLIALICTVGGGIIFLAPSFFILMVGKFLSGIGVRFCLIIALVYTAKVSLASN